MTQWTPHSRMPGGGISRRPLHFIILADCSGGMKGEKIQALNYAIADMMPHLAAWERDQEQAQVFIRAIAFATEPRWHIADPCRSRAPLEAAAAGAQGADQHGPGVRAGGRGARARPDRAPGAAPGPAADHRRAGHRPARRVRDGLVALMAQPAGRAALRLAIAIGRDAQSEALNRFIGDPTVPVLVADSTEDIADRLVAASLAVSRMSEVGADRGAVARRLFGVPRGRAVDLRPGHDRLTAMITSSHASAPRRWIGQLAREHRQRPGAAHQASGLPNQDAVASRTGPRCHRRYRRRTRPQPPFPQRRGSRSGRRGRLPGGSRAAADLAAGGRGGGRTAGR